MKKRLFLLPLLGSFLLSGCTFSLFGKSVTLKLPWEKESSGENQSNSSNSGSNQNNSSNQSSESETSEDFFEFVPKDMQTPSFKDENAGTIQEFTYEDMEFYDRQAYYSDSKQTLWFYNQFDGNYTEEEKPSSSGGTYIAKITNENSKFAFIANKTPFEKAIKKVVVKTNSGTGGPNVCIKFGTSAFTEAVTEKSFQATASKEFSVSNSVADAKYFVIAAYNDVGYAIKNLMLDSIKVYFK